MHKLAGYTAEQLVFVDESALNEHTSHRKYGWAPVGVTPHEYRRFECSERWSVLPAYTIDGFITWEIEHRSFSQKLFGNFIKNKLLPMCSRFPGVRSVIIMDNAPIHQDEAH